jgi:hypothetical protein
MGDNGQERERVQEIVKELKRATLANDAAAVAHCVEQLEGINRENTERSAKTTGNQPSRKRPISDDQFNRPPTGNGGNGGSGGRGRNGGNGSPAAHARATYLKARSGSPKTLTPGYPSRDRKRTGLTATPPGTSLDALNPEPLESVPRGSSNEGRTRCVNWPKCQAGPASIRDNGTSQAHTNSLSFSLLNMYDAAVAVFQWCVCEGGGGPRRWPCATLMTDPC